MILARALLALAVACLPSLSANAQSGSRMVIGPTPMADFAAPIASMQDLKFAGVVKQQFDFSCGSAALATLLRMYGDAHGEEATFRGMWKGGDHAQIRKLGFSLLDMKRYLAMRGRTANGYKVSLSEIAKAGVPGVALVTIKNYRHFVVIQGIRAGEVLVGDPATGLRVDTFASFQKGWNGVFFVIEGDPPRGTSSFNHSRRWSAYARAPLGGRFAEPLSLQALSLTAPFYRDF